MTAVSDRLWAMFRLASRPLALSVCTSMVLAISFAQPSGPGIFAGQSAIGAAGPGGIAVFDAQKGEYRVTGGGADVWGTSDDFHYVWKKISGDLTFSADIGWEGAGAFPRRKAMLMIRQSLDAGSAYVDAAAHGNGLTSLQFRGKSGDQTYQILTQIDGPVRVRIVRKGNRYTVFAGKPDGPLTPLGPVEFINLTDPVYIGLGVCSHLAGTLETAIFTNVTLQQ